MSVLYFSVHQIIILLYCMDHSSYITCHCLYSFHTGILYCLVTEAKGCKQLAQDCYVGLSDWERNHAIFVADPSSCITVCIACIFYFFQLLYYCTVADVLIVNK